MAESATHQTKELQSKSQCEANPDSEERQNKEKGRRPKSRGMSAEEINDIILQVACKGTSVAPVLTDAVSLLMDHGTMSCLVSGLNSAAT